MLGAAFLRTRSFRWWAAVVGVGVLGGLIGAAYVEVLTRVGDVLGPGGFDNWEHLGVLVAVGGAIGALVLLLGDAGRCRADGGQHPCRKAAGRCPRAALTRARVVARDRRRECDRARGTAGADDRHDRGLAGDSRRPGSRRRARPHDLRDGRRVHRPVRRAARRDPVRARDPPSSWARVLRGLDPRRGRRAGGLGRVRGCAWRRVRPGVAVPARGEHGLLRSRARARPRVSSRPRGGRVRVLVADVACGVRPSPELGSARDRRSRARWSRVRQSVRAHLRGGAAPGGRGRRAWRWARCCWPRW